MERVWFKAKTYGWGWTPATWQGWLVILFYIATIAIAGLLFLRPTPTHVGWIAYFSSIAVATGRAHHNLRQNR